MVRRRAHSAGGWLQSKAAWLPRSTLSETGWLCAAVQVLGQAGRGRWFQVVPPYLPELNTGALVLHARGAALLAALALSAS
jgi:hypothetical protein